MARHTDSSSAVTLDSSASGTRETLYEIGRKKSRIVRSKKSLGEKMKEDLKLQCFICKQSILKENSLDPCSVVLYSNVDQDELDQRSQTFFCHFNCFKKVHNDDGTLYLESLETPREMNEENQNIYDNLESFSQMLYENKLELSIWKILFSSPSGKWVKLRDILENNNCQLLNQLDEIENRLFEPLIITWTDDSFNKRSQNRVWKVIIIATESHYEFPVTLLIDFDKKIL